MVVDPQVAGSDDTIGPLDADVLILHLAISHLRSGFDQRASSGQVFGVPR